MYMIVCLFVVVLLLLFFFKGISSNLWHVATIQLFVKMHGIVVSYYLVPSTADFESILSQNIDLFNGQIKY